MAALSAALAGCADGLDLGPAPQGSIMPLSADGGASGERDALSSYGVDAGDRLRVRVFGQPSLSGDYVVDDGGLLSIPLIGNVPVRGLTTARIERAIATRLARGYLRNPHVTVEIIAYRPFFILGQVNRAGQYPYVPGINVQTAIAIAGGYSPRANQRNVKITRRTAKGLRTVEVRPSAPVLPGDTVYVKERWF